MPDGKVSGVFDIDAAPAKRGLRELRADAKLTEQSFAAVGRQVDEFGRKAAEATTVARASISGLRGEVRGLTTDMRMLGAVNARPSVNMGGIARARTEVAALKAELRSLGAVRASPSVGGMGGGAAATAARAAGGGGGGGRGLGGGRIMGVPMWAAGALGAGALAAAPPLVGGAGALLGSASAAGLGAGAVGVGAGGAATVGIASIAALAIPAKKSIQEASKAQQAYNKQVELYGAQSKQAATQKAKLDYVLGNDKGLRRFESGLTRLQKQWKTMTQPGQRALFGGLGDLMAGANKAAPNAANAVNRVGQQGLRPSMSQLGTFAAGQRQQTFVTEMSSTFAGNLPIMERSLEHVFSTLENIARASRPFFNDAVRWTEQWTKGWASSTNDIGKTRHEVGGLVDQFKEWRHLTGAVFRLTRDLFSAGAPSGGSMVHDLTTTLNTWDMWVQRNPEKVKAFFRDAVRDTERIATTLGKLTSFLWEAGRALNPLLQGFLALSNMGLGPLGALLGPGIARAVIAKRMAGGAGGAAAAGGGGIMPMFGGGRGGAGGTGAAAATGARASAAEVAAGRTAGGAFLMGPGATDAVLMRRQAAAEAQLLSQRGIAARTLARSGVGSRVLGGADALMAGGAGATAMRGLGAAGRFLAPVAAVQAGIGALTTQGGIGDRAQGAFSSLSMGLIPAPLSRAGARDKGSQWAQSFVGALPDDPNARLRSLGRKIGSEEKQTTPNSPLLQGALMGPKDYLAHRKQAAELRKQWNIEWRQLQMDLDRRAVSTAQSVSSEMGGAFKVYLRKEGPVKAMQDTNAETIRRMQALRPAGAKVLAQNALDWARQMARDNPKLQGQVEILTESIRKRYRDMGTNISIVNGQIVEQTQAKWKQIGQNIVQPVEVAVQKGRTAFTQLQRMAVSALRSMGFSASAARGMVQGAENRGTNPIAEAQQTKAQVGAAQGGFGGARRVAKRGAGLATGGAVEVGGRGLRDTVPVGNALVAPGEVLVANRHTIRKLDQKLMQHGTNFRREVSQETRPHHQPMALGGVYGNATRYATGGVAAMATGGAAPRLAIPKTGLRGVPGALGDRAISSVGFGFQRRLDAAAAARKPAAAAGGGASLAGLGAAGGGANPRLTAFGRFLQSRGYTVDENPAFGGVHPVHAHYGSPDHYSGGAVDITGGNLPAGVRLIEAAIKAGKLSLWGPGALYNNAPGTIAKPYPGHGSHIHLSAHARGGVMRLATGGRVVGASTYGGPHDPSTPGDSGAYGHLRGTMGFAELGMGKNLGGLKPHSKLPISYGGRTVMGTKLDIGGGGGAVSGHTRAIDLWYQTARALKFPEPGTGLVTVGGSAAASTTQRAGGPPKGATAAPPPPPPWQRIAGGQTGPQLGVPAWGGKHEMGGDFAVRRQTMFSVGERGHRESVRVRRVLPGREHANTAGGGSHTINVDMGGVTVASDVDVDKIGERVAGKIVAALDRMGDHALAGRP